MKKSFKSLLVMMGLLTLGLTSQAQLITKDGAKNLTTYGRVGLNSMSISGDDANGYKSKTGYSLLVGYQKEITSSPVLALYYAMEAGLRSRGWSTSETSGNQKEEYYLFAHNIYVSPVNLDVFLKVSEDFSLDGHVGVYGAFDYYGKYVHKLKVGTQKDSESFSLGDINNYRRYDAGVNFGFGLWYQQFNFDVSFQKGFVDMIEDVNWRTSNIIFSLGYKF